MLWLLPFENYKMLLLALFLSLNSTSAFPGFFGFVVVFYLSASCSTQKLPSLISHGLNFSPTSFGLIR